MNVFDALNEFLDLHYARGPALPRLVYVNSLTYSRLLSDATAQSYYHSNPMSHFTVRGVTIQENRGQANEFFSSAMSWNAPSIPNPPAHNQVPAGLMGVVNVSPGQIAALYPPKYTVQLDEYWSGGVSEQVQSKACECGSTAVGSSNHSNWCPVK